MPVYFGNSNISEIYVGNDAIVAIYRGNEQIWKKPVVYYTLSFDISDINSFEVHYIYNGELTIKSWDKMDNLTTSIDIPSGAEVYIKNIVPDVDESIINTSQEYWSSFTEDTTLYITADIPDEPEPDEPTPEPEETYYTLDISIREIVSYEVVINDQHTTYSESIKLSIPKGSNVSIESIWSADYSYEYEGQLSWDKFNEDASVYIYGTAYIQPTYTLTLSQSDIDSFDIIYKYNEETTTINWNRGNPGWESFNSVSIPAGAEVWIDNVTPVMDKAVGYASPRHWSSFNSNATCELGYELKNTNYILQIDLSEWEFPYGYGQAGYYYNIIVKQGDTVIYELNNAQDKENILQGLSISDASNITASGEFSHYITQGHFEDADEPLNIQLDEQENATAIECYIKITR